MKNNPFKTQLIFTLVIFILSLFTNCKKSGDNEDIIITISNASVYNIDKSSASCIWNINSTGGSSISETGICFKTEPNPTINDTKVASKLSGNGTMSLGFKNLTFNTKYYLRVYAINKKGQITYGESIIFSTPTYYIGQNFNGGIIFYIDNTGNHGLIAAPINQNNQSSILEETPWSNNLNILTNASSENDGALNTQKILSVQGNSGNYAAKLCKDYRGGGYSDWFLPSKYQLQLLYTGKSVTFLETGKVDDFYASFPGGAFWSSTEASKDGAYIINFGNGANPEVYNKTTKNTGKAPYVRTIREF